MEQWKTSEKSNLEIDSLGQVVRIFWKILLLTGQVSEEGILDTRHLMSSLGHVHFGETVDESTSSRIMNV